MTVEQPVQGYIAPERAANYVAYGRESIQTPDENGQPEHFRPQVFVREYPSVLVKEHDTKTIAGKAGTDDLVTTSFRFDARSTGVPNLTHDFYASLRADDPAHAVLLWAEENKAPVTAVLETVRKGKDDDGKPISPRTPIHVLRGAGRDGKNGNANITKSNCKNLVAAVAQPGNPASIKVTTEAVSEPSEWVALRPNRSGEFAPAGWRLVKDDQQQPIGITNMPTAPTVDAPAAPVGDDMVSEIARQVADIIRPMVVSGPAGRPVERPGVAQEEQPWKPWNTDGRLNAGNWAMGKYRAQFDWALNKLVSTGYTATLAGEEVVEAAGKLAVLVLWMTDQVHQRVVPTVGHPWLSKSHAEANRWVQFSIDRLSVASPDLAQLEFNPALMQDAAARRVWVDMVVDQASILFHNAYATVAHSLDPNWRDPVADGQPVPARPAPTVASPTTPASPPAAAQQQPATQPAAMAGDVPELIERYQKLLKATGDQHLAGQPGRARTYLEQVFGAGSGSPAQIPAETFAAQLAQWEQAPQAFLAGAIAAFKDAFAAKN